MIKNPVGKFCILALSLVVIVGCGDLPESSEVPGNTGNPEEEPAIDKRDPTNTIDVPDKTEGEPDTIQNVDEIKGKPELPPVKRVLDESNEFPFVGVITYGGSLRCTGTIIEHGLMVTAKHCFKTIPSASRLKTIDLGFPYDGIFDSNDVKVTGNDILELFHDGDGNDLAYIRYTASATEGKVPLPDFPVVKEVPSVGTDLVVVGFPSQADRKFRKLITENCQVLDRSGFLGPKPRDEGYDGKLFDSDCGAWFGNSGGPFFTVSYDENGARVLEGFVGVVTHTFDVDSLGNIQKEFIINDSFGEYVRTVNFSPFAQANVDFLLN